MVASKRWFLFHKVVYRRIVGVWPFVRQWRALDHNMVTGLDGRGGLIDNALVGLGLQSYCHRQFGTPLKGPRVGKNTSGAALGFVAST